MNALRLFLAAAVLLVFNSAHAGYSRGPYLPQNSELKTSGTLVERDGLNERCESGYSAVCQPNVEYVLTRPPSGFEFGKIIYNCYEIDDGPDGVLKCEQLGYKTESVYALCTLGGTKTSPTDFDFRGWICR